MWLRWGGILALGCGILLGADGPPPPKIPPVLTLKEALEIALDRSPALRLAAARERAAEGDRLLARSELLPHFGVRAAQESRQINLEAMGLDRGAFAGESIPDIQSRVGPFGVFDARAIVTQTLFNLTDQRAAKAAAQQRAAATQSALDTRETLAYGVAVAYIEALRAQAGTATVRRQLALARQLHTITTDRLEQGVASRLDERRSLQQVRFAQQRLLEAEAGLTAAKYQLAATIHAQPAADFELADIDRFYRAHSIDPDEAVGRALAARRDYQAAKVRLTAAETAHKAAAAVRLPRATFYADYGQSGTRPHNNLSTYTVRGEVGIPLYFGGAATAEDVRSQARVDAARAEHDQIVMQVETETRVAAETVESAQQAAELATEVVELAEEEVDLTLTRFTSGVADNSDVLVAQERLTRAEQDRVRALHRLHLAEAELHRAVGKAEETYRR